MYKSHNAILRYPIFAESIDNFSAFLREFFESHAEETPLQELPRQLEERMHPVISNLNDLSSLYKGTFPENFDIYIGYIQLDQRFTFYTALQEKFQKHAEDREPTSTVSEIFKQVIEELDRFEEAERFFLALCNPPSETNTLVFSLDSYTKPLPSDFSLSPLFATLSDEKLAPYGNDTVVFNFDRRFPKGYDRERHQPCFGLAWDDFRYWQTYIDILLLESTSEKRLVFYIHSESISPKTIQHIRNFILCTQVDVVVSSPLIPVANRIVAPPTFLVNAEILTAEIPPEIIARIINDFRKLYLDPETGRLLLSSCGQLARIETIDGQTIVREHCANSISSVFAHPITSMLFTRDSPPPNLQQALTSGWLYPLASLQSSHTPQPPLTLQYAQQSEKQREEEEMITQALGF